MSAVAARLEQTHKVGPQGEPQGEDSHASTQKGSKLDSAEPFPTPAEPHFASKLPTKHLALCRSKAENNSEQPSVQGFSHTCDKKLCESREAIPEDAACGIERTHSYGLKAGGCVSSWNRGH